MRRIPTGCTVDDRFLPVVLWTTDSYRLYCGRQIPTGCTAVDDRFLPVVLWTTDSYRLYCCGRQIPTGCTVDDRFLLPVALWIQMCEVSVLMNETTGLFPIALFDSLSLRHLGTRNEGLWAPRIF